MTCQEAQDSRYACRIRLGYLFNRHEGELSPEQHAAFESLIDMFPAPPPPKPADHAARRQRMAELLTQHDTVEAALAAFHAETQKPAANPTE